MLIIFLFLLAVAGVWLVFGSKAAGKTILITFLLGFIAFALLAIVVIWTIAAPCSAPFTDHNSTQCQAQGSTSIAPSQPVEEQTVQTPTQSGVLPSVVGQCDSTTVTQIGTRLTDGSTGSPIPGSGSAIWYRDGGYQVSYDSIQGVTDSQIGDHINLCLVSIPTNCPAGDNRGRVYQATNLRTNENWEASDAEHSCGGA